MGKSPAASLPPPARWASRRVTPDADKDARHSSWPTRPCYRPGAQPRATWSSSTRSSPPASRPAPGLHPGYGFLSEERRLRGAARKPASSSSAPSTTASARWDKIRGQEAGERGPGQHHPLATIDGDSPGAGGFPTFEAGHRLPGDDQGQCGGAGKGMRGLEKGSLRRAGLLQAQRGASFGDDRASSRSFPARATSRSRCSATPTAIRLSVRARLLGAAPAPEVLEEAPARHDPERRADGQGGRSWPARSGYVGAGMVEFIANQDGSFYFMEMNAPAGGAPGHRDDHRPRSGRMAAPRRSGRAVAAGPGEHPPSTATPSRRASVRRGPGNFLPSTGSPAAPACAAESLHDARRHRRRGGRRDPFYDPMIAKLIVWDVNRDRALARMLQALADYRYGRRRQQRRVPVAPHRLPGLRQRRSRHRPIEREGGPVSRSRGPPAARPGWRGPSPSLLREARAGAASASAEPIRPGTSATAGASTPTPGQPDLPFRRRAEASVASCGTMASRCRWTADQTHVVRGGSTNAAACCAPSSTACAPRHGVVAGERRMRHVFATAGPGSLPRSIRCTTAARGRQCHGLLAPMPGKVIAILPPRPAPRWEGRAAADPRRP